MWTNAVQLLTSADQVTAVRTPVLLLAPALLIAVAVSLVTYFSVFHGPIPAGDLIEEKSSFDGRYTAALYEIVSGGVLGETEARIEMRDLHGWHKNVYYGLGFSQWGWVGKNRLSLTLENGKRLVLGVDEAPYDYRTSGAANHVFAVAVAAAPGLAIMTLAVLLWAWRNRRQRRAT